MLVQKYYIEIKNLILCDNVVCRLFMVVSHIQQQLQWPKEANVLFTDIIFASSRVASFGNPPFRWGPCLTWFCQIIVYGKQVDYISSGRKPQSQCLLVTKTHFIGRLVFCMSCTIDPQLPIKYASIYNIQKSCKKLFRSDADHFHVIEYEKTFPLSRPCLTLASCSTCSGGKQKRSSQPPEISLSLRILWDQI